MFVVEKRLGAEVEDLVEAVDHRLRVDAAAGPVAVGAAEPDPPAPVRRRRPVDREDELGLAGRAEVEVAGAARRPLAGAAGESARVEPVDGDAGRRRLLPGSRGVEHLVQPYRPDPSPPLGVGPQMLDG
jgi:hypothetical protein